MTKDEFLIKAIAQAEYNIKYYSEQLEKEKYLLKVLKEEKEQLTK